MTCWAMTLQIEWVRYRLTGLRSGGIAWEQGIFNLSAGHTGALERRFATRRRFWLTRADDAAGAGAALRAAAV
jgi:hypothetical protein